MRPKKNIQYYRNEFYPTTSGGTSDHGALSGLTDNDHPQYRLTATTIDHGSLGGLTDNDHPQYRLTATTLDHGEMDGLSDNDHPQYALTGSNVEFTNISATTIYSGGVDLATLIDTSSADFTGDTITLNTDGTSYTSQIIFGANTEGAPLNDGLLQYDSAGTGKFLIDNDLRVSGGTMVIGDGGGLTNIYLGDDTYSDGYIIGGFPADTVAIGPILKTPTLSADTIYSGSVDLATLLGGGGVSDHGSLTGLLDNDHPQYALTGSNVEFDTITGTQIYITDEYLNFEGGTDGYIRYRTSDNRFICVRPWQIFGSVSGENFYATASLHSNNNLYLDHDGNGTSSSVFFHDGTSISGGHIQYVNADNSFNINKPVMINNPITFTGSGTYALDVVRPGGGFIDSAFSNRQIHITFPDTVNWWSSEAMITMELTVADNSSTGGSAKMYIHGKTDYFTVDEGVPVKYAKWENTSVKVVSTDTTDRYDVSFCASASLSSSATSPILAIGTLTSDWNARVTIDRVMVNDANISYDDVVSGWTVEYSATEPFSAHTTHTNDPGVVTDHGALTGLLDNDHPQYRLTADTIPATEITGLDYYTDADVESFITGNTIDGGIIIEGDLVSNSAIDTYLTYKIRGNTILRVLDGNSMAVGVSADAIGSNTTSVGFDAGNGNGSVQSVYVGGYAGGGTHSLTGNYQTFIGYAAGLNADGARNTGVGLNAGREDTGSYTTSVGAAAGYKNSGSYSSFMGYQSGEDNTGSYTIGVGYGTLYQNIGDRVQAFGWQAGLQNSGDSCVFIGSRAGRYNALDNQFIVQHETANATPLIQGDFSTLETTFNGDVRASGLSSNGDIYTNYGGPDGDSYLYFYEGSSNTGRSLKWDDTSNRFEFDDDVRTSGSFWAGGNVISDGNIYVNYNGPDGDSRIYFYEDSGFGNEYIGWNNTSDRFEISDDVNVSGQILSAGTDIATMMGGSSPVYDKTMSILDPTTAEDITLMYCPVATTILSGYAVVRGSVASTTWALYSGTSRASATSAIAATTTTNTTTADIEAINKTVAAGAWLVIKTFAVGSSTDEFSITFTYTKD